MRIPIFILPSSLRSRRRGARDLAAPPPLRCSRHCCASFLAALASLLCSHPRRAPVLALLACSLCSGPCCAPRPCVARALALLTPLLRSRPRHARVFAALAFSLYSRPRCVRACALRVSSTCLRSYFRHVLAVLASSPLRSNSRAFFRGSLNMSIPLPYSILSLYTCSFRSAPAGGPRKKPKWKQFSSFLSISLFLLPPLSSLHILVAPVLLQQVVPGYKIQI